MLERLYPASCAWGEPGCLSEGALWVWGDSLSLVRWSSVLVDAESSPFNLEPVYVHHPCHKPLLSTCWSPGLPRLLAKEGNIDTDAAVSSSGLVEERGV